MSCGVLDEEEFSRCCQLLLHHSDSVGDGWSWEAVQSSDEGYLKKTVLRSVPADQSITQKHKESGSDSEQFDYCRFKTEEQGVNGSADSLRPDVEDEDDCVCRAPGGSSCSSVLQFEYHVLYSCSYRTPVLYFRASTLEGRSLTLEDVWNSVHPNYRLGLQSRPLDAITQQEHPFLGQAFFFLHPCRTEEFMKPLLQMTRDPNRPVNYVLSWLSVVGPMVGLDVSLDYVTLQQPTV
ncbi:Ubiquitin-like-conjugating enzyme ATG10 [Oryzias melastigma]|uniref:Ubiquitin-like-conjugating enzyme ATG10 n=1 Tax=Oryzias melastigma TaxID=30732 RepID=A0A834C4T8_ORYME|nr:Ubiquitin-like-conjugating enzyme ATG10 [Oryzias melastigma]